MNTKEITIEFIDNLKMIIKYKFRKKEQELENFFDEEVLYAGVFKKDADISFNVEKDSLLYMFTLLSSKPKKDETTLENSYVYFTMNQTHQQESYVKITEYNQFLRQNLFNMLQFINLSSYLYELYLAKGTKEERKNLLLILITAASNMYEELYSSRGKIEFAYYFKKVLENNNQVTTRITPYNKESWRGDYAKYTKAVKTLIDTFDEEEILSISNIKFIYGKRVDERLPNLGERYVIEAGISNHSREYKRIFITNFS